MVRVISIDLFPNSLGSLIRENIELRQVSQGRGGYGCLGGIPCGGLVQDESTKVLVPQHVRFLVCSVRLFRLTLTSVKLKC